MYLFICLILLKLNKKVLLMKKFQILLIDIRSVFCYILLSINTILVFISTKVSLPVYYNIQSVETSSLSIYNVIRSPGEYLLAFLLFMTLVLLLTNITLKTFLFTLSNWNFMGFILKFTLTSWNISLFSTSCYLSYYIMAIEGIIIMSTIFIIIIFYYFNSKTAL